MEKTVQTTLMDARKFFADELMLVMQKHHLSAQPESVQYLTSLMLRYMESDKFFVVNQNGKFEDTVLLKLYSEYAQGSIETKKVALQRMGDICLLVSGFFAESLQKKLVDISYYFGMGGNAYQELSSLHAHVDNKILYSELAVKFEPFSNVLNEIGEKTHVQTDADVLRVYERWLTTGSERLREVLTQKGIQTPSLVDIKTKH